MPDLISVISRRWKLISTLTLIATSLAFIACLLSPKQYLGVTTALPANSLVNDKARIFNQNIEALYSEIGTADELDKIEGTSQLDTIFLAVATDFHLIAHYSIDSLADDALEKAASKLKQHSTISRTGYGELKIKVWDKDNNMAAALANALLQKINDIHQRLQTENNRNVLQKLKEEYALKQQAFDSIQHAGQTFLNTTSETTVAKEQLIQYARLINEYELALKTAPKALLVVEYARPSPWADKPKTSQTVLLAFLASLLFSFLLALFVESRN